MTHREIVEEPNFRSQLLEIEPDPKRADAIVDGAKWVLCRHPEEGTQLGPAVPVWFLPVFLTQGRAVLWYTFDERTVYLMSIRRRSEV